jgi:hypothetical protein
MPKWRMAAEVTAAWIAAAGAAIAAAASIWATLRTERQRRDAELMVEALEYFERSQRRSVGIAALTVLREGRPGTWKEYRKAVSELFYRQLLYLFAHGENRWKAHEISNIEGMADWLLAVDMPPLTSEMGKQLSAAMDRYIETWKRLPPPQKSGNDADPEAVAHLVKRIDTWQTKLKMIDSTSAGSPTGSEAGVGGQPSG